MKTILLVDDEEILLESIAEMLEREGYKVLAADGGATALGLIESQSSIEALITDMKMPRINGLTVARKFHEKFPNAPICIVSGHLDAAVAAREYSDLGSFVVLSKPVLIADLLAWLRG